ncbi:DUF2992 family protein [Krasilnikovia sp. M28-CT-15]|uniref:DUF2992 family protein n=1 Tax=Krasilnikovia sp. M28-CT-15 TaxID=3373540 RepID=UPI0038767872
MGSRFTVFHDGSYWVGLLEIEDGDQLRAARVIFGDEPTGPELAAFAAGGDFGRLVQQVLAAPPVPVAAAPEPGRRHARRAAREAAREAGRPPVSTKAQAALAAAFEQRKAERMATAKQRRGARAAHRRAAAVAKAKARHRGR